MQDVTLTPQTIAVVTSLMGSLVLAISVLSAAIAYLYRQVLKERDRLLDERNERLQDCARDKDELAIRITALEAMNERLQTLANDATAVARQLAEDARARQA